MKCPKPDPNGVRQQNMNKEMSSAKASSYQPMRRYPIPFSSNSKVMQQGI